MQRIVLSECLLERSTLDEVTSDAEKTEEKRKQGKKENRNSQVPHFPTSLPC